MRPAYAPTGAGRGDAVSGIKRADSASGKLTVSMVRQLFGACNGSRIAGSRIPKGGLQKRHACGVSTADRRVPHESVRGAYPPPRESCVRGADRAAVDKPFHFERRGRRLRNGWRNAPDDLAKVQIGRFVEQRISRHADGTHKRPDGKPAQCASREPRDEEV